MTALIDTIETAFLHARDEAEINGGEIRADTVAEAIEQYVKTSDQARGSLERIIVCAYREARDTFGPNEWPDASGDVAEIIASGLREFVTA